MEFYWEQMRGVVGTGGMPPEAVKWWVDTLKKVDRHQEVAGGLHQAQHAHAVQWTGEEANKYLDGLNAKYEKALGDLGALKK